MPLIRARVQVDGYEVIPASLVDFFTPDVKWKQLTVGAGVTALGVGLAWMAPKLIAKVLGVGMAIGGLVVLVNSFGGGPDFNPTSLGDPNLSVRSE